MPNSEICVLQLLYICLMKKYISHKSAAASLVKNSLLQYSEQSAFSYAAKTKSNSWSAAREYYRVSKPPYYNLRAAFNKEVERPDVYHKLHTQVELLYAQQRTHAWVTCYYMCIWDQQWIQVQTNISAAILLQKPFTYHYRVSSVMSFFPFQELLTAGIGLYPHNHVSNCQQEAILKSHLSKILRAYSREDNHFQKEVRWAWLEHSRYASSSGSCWLLQAWQAAIKSVLVQQAKSWFNSWFTTSYFLKHQFLIPGKQHRVTVKHL